MIQRIQTVYLVLAAAAAFALLKLPFAQSSEAVTASAFFKDSAYQIQDHVALMIFFILAGVLSLASIFLFNNRSLQLKICRFAVIANVLGLVFSIIFYLQDMNTLEGVGVDDGIGLYLPIGFLIFGILALRAIQKDENLVKSMDRLR